LHINLEDEPSADNSDAAETENEESGLEKFSTDSNSEDKEDSSLSEFSASDDSGDSEEMSAIEDLDATETADIDQVDDAGLGDADAIQEELPQETEQVDTNGIS